MSVAVQDQGDMDDSKMSAMFGSFCLAHREELLRRGIRRITFASLKKCVIMLGIIICSKIEY